MKKIISIIVVAALLMSLSCIPAFSSTGPYIPEDPKAVGARLGFYDPKIDDYIWILNIEDGAVVISDEIVGASYDPETNTLTLTDFDHPDFELYGSYMGDDFTINVTGACNLRTIYLQSYFVDHSTGLTIDGTGTLTVNENKWADEAVYIVNDQDSSSKFTIGSDVTVNLYGDVSSIYLYGTDVDKDNALTAGGKPIQNVQSEEIIYEDAQTVGYMYYHEYNWPDSRGYLLRSKSDPDGIYTATIWKESAYWIDHYIYYPEFNAYGEDPEFPYTRLTEEQFLEDYDYVIASQPVKVPFFTQYDFDHRGNHGYRVTNSDCPDDVYVAVEDWAWDSDDDDPDGYEIYRVNWDEDESYYVEDPDFDSETYANDEMDESGYTFVTEKVEKNRVINCWVMPLTEENEDDNYKKEFEVVKKAEAPDTLYVREPYWYSYDFDEPPAGYTIYPVYVDEESGEYYVDSYNYDIETDFSVSAEDFPTSGFSVDRGIFDERVECWFTYDYYNPKYDASTAILLSKNGDEATYGYNPNHTYTYADSDRVEYMVYKLAYDEYHELWIADDTCKERMTLDEMAENGYTPVCADQKVEYYLDGCVYVSTSDVYTDDDGARYANDWGDIYKIDENEKRTFNDKDYYFAEYCEDLSIDDLHDTITYTPSGRYKYWVEDDFTYPESSGEGSTVSGTVVSYITDSDVTLELLRNDAVVASTTVTGTVDAESPKNSQPVPFSIEGVEDGAYTLRVSKANHVTRSYAITVSGDTAVDEVVKICPLGDANNDGVVDAKDVTRTYRHALTAIELTGYQYDCANVATKNPAVNASDVTKIYRHVLESESLWT